MPMQRSTCAVLVVAMLALVGCTDPNSGQLSGLVTVDKQPLAEGTIMFEAEDGKAPTAGGPIRDGKYSVKVSVGVMKVTIKSPKVVGTKKLYNTPNSPEGTITKEALPARYNDATTLRHDVPAGASEKNWDLDGK
jgi:hypothetical protein